MIALIQRVINAEVRICEKTAAKINNGLLIFLGIAHEDGEKQSDYLIKKILNLRIFEDENKKMNLSILDLKGDILLVSQFTLCADTKKGNRPSFVKAAPPEKAEQLYLDFINRMKKEAGNLKIETGVFAADMKVSLINDGPVTIWLDTED
ncbi:MAG: D-aminoacyl-tRNA deacylase [Spirochaetia bacterium]|nr:D-aminoacyl-tRNA deacylase [Spirochaetia bacterium]